MPWPPSTVFLDGAPDGLIVGSSPIGNDLMRRWFSCRQQEELQMTDPHRTSSSEDVDEQADRLEEQADAMERSDRAIPLPDESKDEGVGPVTGVVP